MKREGVRFVFNPTELVPLIVEADLAICSGGITLAEMAALGTPAVAVTQNYYQHFAASEFHRRGTCIHLGYGKDVTEEKIKNTVRRLITSYDLRKEMSHKGRKLVDGKGAIRVVKEILKVMDER